jgi:hypothetical protein
MKVSKRQLKRIIREEKNKLIAETRIRRTIRRVIREAAGDLGESASVAEIEAIAKGMTPMEQSKYFTDFIRTAPEGKLPPDSLKWLVTNVQSQNVNNKIQSYIGAPRGHSEFAGKELEPKYQEIHGLMEQMYSKFKEDEVTAKDPSTPLNVLQQLASNKGHRYKDVRMAIAQHPNASPELLEDLVETNPYHVAQNPNTPAEILEKLGSHSSNLTRTYVAYHPNTPTNVLMQFVTDSGEDVRSAVAGNTNLPPGGLQKLATDQSKYIRIEVAKNPSTSPKTLEQLTGDRVATVRNKAKKNLKSR